MDSLGFLIFLILGGFIFFLIVFTWLIPVQLWVAAWASGAKVNLLTLIGMRLRKIPPKMIIEPRISASKAGIDVPIEKLEAHFLAGGRVSHVVNALISADKANIKLIFDRAAAIDLAGRNVLEAVKMSVNPKVISTPLVSAVAKDGIQLKVISRITLRANIDRLVGGAGEETILARVGEGIVTTIGSAENYKIVLENPDLISKRVLQKGLDAGTAFEILSIDIADVDVGENVGAQLQEKQAEADKKIAQAKAEGKRAMAVATEQEMKARVQEMKAKVIEAECEVPLAIASALKAGNMGVMDYVNYKNVIADTDMRNSFSKVTSDDKKNKE